LIWDAIQIWHDDPRTKNAQLKGAREIARQYPLLVQNDMDVIDSCSLFRNESPEALRTFSILIGYCGKSSSLIFVESFGLPSHMMRKLEIHIEWFALIPEKGFV
jgi:hypothetical protein